MVKISTDILPQLLLTLSKLGYSGESPFIQKLKNELLVDLNEKDRLGFTPLRLAIQKNDSDAIEFILSLEPNPQHLTQYDSAFLNNDDSEMKHLEMPNHMEIIFCAQALYPIDAEGLCVGISEMRRQAVLAGEKNIFCKRLKNIHATLTPVVMNAMQQIGKELADAEEDKDAKESYINLGHGITASVKVEIKTIFFDKLREKIDHYFSCMVWLDILAFFDGVILYQFPNIVAYLFETERYIAQNASMIETLLRPIALDSKIKPAEISPLKRLFLKAYTPTTLEIYFNLLSDIFRGISFSLRFNITKHQFCIDFDGNKWSFTDSNHLKHTEEVYTNQEVVNLILEYYSDRLVIATEITAASKLTEEQAQFNQALSKLNAAEAEQTFYVPVPASKEYNTLLWEAARCGLIDIVTILIDKYTGDISSIYVNEITPLNIAVIHGHLDIVKLFLKILKNNINQPDVDGRTALWAAISYRQYEIADLLIEALNGNVDAINQPSYEKGESPLLIAARAGDLKAVRLLLKALNGNVVAISKPINKKEVLTPLWIAASNGYTEVVKEILAALNGNVAAISKPSKPYRMTPLWIAAQNGHTEVVKEILKALKNNVTATNKPDEDGITPLWIAAQNGNFEIVTALLNALDGNSAAIDQPNSKGVTPLSIANINGHVDIVIQILNALGCEVDAIKQPVQSKANNVGPKKQRFPSLIWEAINEQDLDKVLEVIIQQKGNLAELTATNEKGISPLFFAAEIGCIDLASALVEELKENIVALTAADEDGITPLWIATQNDHLNVVNLLVNALKGNVAAINLPNDAGVTPFCVAVIQGRVGIVKSLAAALKADITEMTAPLVDGKSPLQIAALQGNDDIVKTLVECFGNNLAAINKCDNGRVTPLWVAAQEGHVNIATLLIDSLQGDIGAMTASRYDGTSPLWIAAEIGHDRIVRLLVERFNRNVAAINKPDNRGITPLWIASYKNNFAVVKLLVDALKHDFDAIHYRCKGQSPLEVATEMGHSTIIKMLSECSNMEAKASRDGLFAQTRPSTPTKGVRSKIVTDSLTY